MNNNRRSKLPAVFGTLGYLALLLQWTWALTLLVPPLLRLDSVQTFVMPKTGHSVVEQPQTPLVMPPIVTYVAVAVAFVIVLVGIYFAIKSPAYAVKRVDTSSKKTANAIARRTARHPENVQEIRRLSARWVWVIKAVAVLVAFIATLGATEIVSGLSMAVIVTVGGYLAIWPVVWFGLEYLVRPRL